MREMPYVASVIGDDELAEDRWDEAADPPLDVVA
jgi:hypothetical protein